MPKNYIVNVKKVPKLSSESLQLLSKRLKADPTRLERLLANLPGVATKAISEDEAKLISQYFNEAGLITELIEQRSNEQAKPKPTAKSNQAESKAEPKTSVKDIKPKSAEQVKADLNLDKGFWQSKPQPNDNTGLKQNSSSQGQEASVKPMSYKERIKGSKKQTINLKKAEQSKPKAHLGESEDVAEGDQESHNKKVLSRTAILEKPNAPASYAKQQELSFTPIPNRDPKAAQQRTDLNFESAQITGRKSRVSVSAKPSGESAIQSSSLRQKWFRIVLTSVFIASLGTVAVAGNSLWRSLQESSKQLALSITQSSAATLSRSIEENGDISQFTTLPSPLPKQDQLNSQLVITTNISSTPFATWPTDFDLTPELNSRIKEQAIISIAQGGSVQSVITTSSNPFASKLILSTHPLEHGNAVVGTVTSALTYEPMLAGARNTFIRMLLLSLIPILLACLVGLWRARQLANRVLELVAKAEDVSRGKLTEPIYVQSNDELKDLGSSLERLRVTTKTSLDRLRDRRDSGF